MTEKPSSNPNGFGLALSGAILQAFTVYGIIRAAPAILQFRSGSNSSIGDPSQLSALIGETLISISSAMLVPLVGAVLILIAMFACRYRAPWLFKFLIIMGILYLPLIPLGSLIGIVFLILAITTRKSHLAAK